MIVYLDNATQELLRMTIIRKYQGGRFTLFSEQRKMTSYVEEVFSNYSNFQLRSVEVYTATCTANCHSHTTTYI